ncbi:MAG TPA: tyrosine-protein phosphatase [Pyrinomonadaceae bacterium]
MKLTRARFVPATLLTLLALTLSAFAQDQKAQQRAAFPQIKIKNFGQMDERFYRGAQPKEGDYRDLAALGIKTIIDLRDNPTDYERPAAEAAGMRYVNIPMSDKDYPKDEQINAFLRLANDPATGKFYVHCAGGRHRTGVAGAVYRFNVNHWDYDRVYAEMKFYDFYTRFGHGDMKKYVEDYWQKVQAQHTQHAAAAAAATH